MKGSLKRRLRKAQHSRAQQTQSARIQQYADAYEVVFVDTDTADCQQLVDDLLSHQSEVHRFEVYILDNSSDGIEQISDVLSGDDSLDDVHIISHGTDGYIDIGATRLDVQML
ncbi:MAG: putative O-methyltransferase YrrM [Granulosicoccus sp.]|jgi:predicted O-methyltransferase YrrM